MLYDVFPFLEPDNAFALWIAGAVATAWLITWSAR